MSFRLTIVLLVILVALGAVVFFVDQSPATPTPSATGATVMSFLSSDATQLEATTKDQSVLVVKDASGNWQLQKPEVAPADQLRVESAIAELAALTATRTLDPPGDLAQFGLAEPVQTVKVTLASGGPKTLLLGAQSPDKSGYYAKLPDSGAVYLIDASVGADLSQLVASPPKATPTPTPEPSGTPGAETPGVETPVAGTPAAETPTLVPAASAATPSVPPAAATTPAAVGTPAPDALPAQAPAGTPVIPDVPLPPGAPTPTPAG